jgi:hypothetical protein
LGGSTESTRLKDLSIPKREHLRAPVGFSTQRWRETRLKPSTSTVDHLHQKQAIMAKEGIFIFDRLLRFD